MKKLFLLFLLCGIFCNGLSAQDKTAQVKAKQDILAAETALCNMAKEKGLEAAFLAFAADDAVICKTTKIYKGKEGIKEYFARKDKNDKLTWKPLYVDVSEAADMGYTYGEYDFEGVRVGRTITDHGVFHTIWKKQPDGSWKFVVN